MTAALLQQAGDTAGNLASLNRVYAARQIVVETDTGKFKIGDGATAWNSLAYAGGSSPDATTGAKGVVQLANDLGGTAAAPTTPTAVHLAGSETITGIKAFSASPTVPTPTTSTQAAPKGYVDGVAAAGAPDASTTVKGIAKLATAPASSSNPIAVGDNDPRVAAVEHTTNKGAASGYLGLGSDSLAVPAQLASGTADATHFLRGDKTWAVPAGGGGGAPTVAAVSSGGAIPSTGPRVEIADATGAPFTRTLPTPVGNSGLQITVDAVTTGTNLVTLATAAASIDGAATVTLGTPASGAPYKAVTVISDNVVWRII
jgi:hypothetical protein